MIDYSILKLLETTVGSVSKIVDKIEVDGVVKWNRTKFRYVSLGDSIAAGHSINSNWETDYGVGSQFESNGRTETVIVPNCYTDLIKNKLASIYKGEEHIKCKSFAHSGYTPDDIMRYIGYTPNEDGTFSVNENSPAVKALKEADLVTICVGANVLLLPAIMFVFNYMGDFVQNGDFTELENVVDAGLKTLNGGGYSKVEVDWYPKPFEFKYSYKELLTALTSINPNAKFVFTSIYNPLKYLYLEGGVNGSFRGLLDIIPDMTILGFELDEYYKKLIISALPADFLKHINTIADWTEEHVEGSATYDGLNRILRKAIEDFGNDNIVLAETKPFYESFPDRPIMSDKHYNDLINLQITAGYDLGDMDWSRLWGAYGKTREAYWWDLITKHTSPESGFNIGGIGFEFLMDFLIYVLPYYIDPHPFEYGQAMLARSFADTIKSKFNIDLGYDDLVHYNLEYNPNTSNGGAGEAEITEIIGLNSEIFVPIKKLKFTTLSAQEGYYFTDWISANYGYASGYYDVEGNLLCYYIKPTSNDTLYAQWSNMYTLTYNHSNQSDYYKDSETGHMECYELRANGYYISNGYGLNEYGDLGAFTNDAAYIPLAYGSIIEVAGTWYNGGILYKSASVDIYLNGTSVANNSSNYPSGKYPYGTSNSLTFPKDTSSDVAYLKFKIKGDVTVTFVAKTNAPAIYNKEAYWDCEIKGDIEIIN